MHVATLSHDAMPRTEVEYLLHDALKRAGRLPELSGGSIRQETPGQEALSCNLAVQVAILLCSLSALQSALQLEMMGHLKHADIEGSWHGPAERGQLVPTLGTSRRH